MSIPERSTLTQLAHKCLELERLLGLEKWDYDIFLDVQGRINDLQADCPKEESIIDARIKWYRRGLDSFKECIPQMLETPPTHRESRVDGQIMDLYTLEYFLFRRYLNHEFIPFYKEVLRLCTRTMKAANRRGIPHFAKAMLDLRNQLEKSVLEARR